MRCFFTAITLVFVQLISLQYVSGKELSAQKNRQQKHSSIIKSCHYKFSKKHTSSFKKILFEDLPFVHHTLKKSTPEFYLFSGNQEKFKYDLVLKVKDYHSFPDCCYSFIFDHLYPKHVFW